MTDAHTELVPDVLVWLQRWYADQCDGDWEHGEGVSIGTLDNPGWRVEIGLDGTTEEGRLYQPVRVERTDDDWIHCWVDGVKWHAACGPLNLTEALGVFRAWIEHD